MSSRRMTRVNELLRREIGGALYRVVTQGSADLARVTITHVITASNLRTANVLVSVRGDHAQKEAIMALLSRVRGRIQGEIAKNVVLKYTPRLSFKLDLSIEQGDGVLDILNSLEATDDGE